MKFIRKVIKAVVLTFGVLFLALIGVAVVVAMTKKDTSAAIADGKSPGTDAKPKIRSCASCNYDEDDGMAVVTAHEMIKRHLRDPGSAIWDGQRSWTDQPVVLVARTDDGGIRAICGTVNAKNSFGGYTGDQIYIVSLEKDVLRVGASDQEFRDLCL